jgi:Zn finger protein HypA/HybF involved in hydrogenase expression
MRKRFVFLALVLALGSSALVSVIAQDAPKPAASTAQAVAAAASAPAPADSAASAPAEAKEVVCFESRKGASELTQRELKPGLPNVKCSPRTGAALWYGDPYDGTVPMGKMPQMDKVPEGKAVVRPRSEKMTLLAQCGTACHNGIVPKGFPKDNRPIPIPTMESMVPDLKNFQHGRGRIWCLDCHHPTKRNMLVDHFGDPISMDQPQLLCGKCHGDKLRDWRDGIHGKRIGQFVSMGKQRWFTCPECHNPHNVQDGERNKGFMQLQPESPPQLPRGFKDAKHEKTHPIAH